MRKIIKYLFLVFIILNTTACMNTITRFWNGDGYYPSPARNKILDECMDEHQEIEPEPLHEDLTTGASRQRRHRAVEWVAECAKRKGYK